MNELKDPSAYLPIAIGPLEKSYFLDCGSWIRKCRKNLFPNPEGRILSRFE